jgi:hypothetical protein
MRIVKYGTYESKLDYTIYNTICDAFPKKFVGSLMCEKCEFFRMKNSRLKSVTCSYFKSAEMVESKENIIFTSEEQAIKTAEIMFACTGFQPWTKEKIIKRLKEHGMIKSTIIEETKNSDEINEIIKNDFPSILRVILRKFYHEDIREGSINTDFKEYLKKIADKGSR